MLPELGFIALLFASSLAILQGTLPWIGLRLGRGEFIRAAWPLACSVFVLQLCAIGLLSSAFALDDFSVAYVAQHSNSRLPFFFKLAATWGGHEGSMLFFVFAIALWAALIACRSPRIELAITARVLAILGAIVAALSLFTLFVSNPFARQFPAPFEGRDLNPMLQDVALIFHPPLLYLGYVGFSVSFAFALAAMLHGRLDSALVRGMRPWALAAWCFLTIGIALGSWWAYYELGWGGWWFWDPVENASLLPWLLGTAMLHALIAYEKRGVLGYSVLLLCIFTFALSLLGTFIVRSGVLSSVHAFSLAPGPGAALLLLLGALLTFALSLFALKGHAVQKAGAGFALFSKEGSLDLIVAVLCIAAACVLLGTFYPLLYQMLGFGNISVGAPYFNQVFVPLCLLLVAILPFLPFLRWQRISAGSLRAQWPYFLGGAALGTWLCLRHSLPTDAMTLLASILACWSIASLLAALIRGKGQHAGLYLAHLGVGLAVLGAAQASQFSEENWAAMAKGQPHALGVFDFVLEKSEPLIGPNYTSEQVTIRVEKSGRILTRLMPERRHYEVRSMTMNETGIAWGWSGDLHATLGEKLKDGTWVVHLQHKPMMSCVWLGALLMATGGIFGAFRCALARTAAAREATCGS